MSRLAFRGADILSRAGADGSPVGRLDSTDADLPEPGDRLDLDGTSAERHADDTAAPAGWEWKPFRSLVSETEEREWRPAARAKSLLEWRATTRFCGRCGAPNGDAILDGTPARVCAACGAQSFPRISPAILAVVRRDGHLLLARNARSPLGFWSLVAGFVEPGESFEDCVRREVAEEVGIEVEATGYLGSQPWPFPDQLMIGFEARWVSGELKPDGVEIAEAGWFGPDDHPPLPRQGSLSRRLIDLALASAEPPGGGRSA